MTNECRVAEVSKTIDQVAEDGKKVELKPCPFCGMEAEERYIQRKLRYRLFKFPDITHFVYIKCKCCGATTSVRETRENAIEWWNRRAND